MIQLFLNTNFSDQGFFNFGRSQRSFFDFLYSDEHVGGLVLGQLDLAVGSFSEVRLSALNELEILFGDGAEHLFESDLLGS